MSGEKTTCKNDLKNYVLNGVFKARNRRIVQNPRSGVEVTLQEFLRALLFMQAQLLQTLQIGSGFLYTPLCIRPGSLQKSLYTRSGFPAKHVVHKGRLPTESAANRV